MADRQSGLRFDIYERVHLADHTVGVQELDEVELVPHIQVYTEGEQAYLKGNLYLTGSYSGETGGEQRTLEHLIPVEITLPLNRIQDVNQVQVDIDNFDVDLLSPRSLNVTGVLTLHGIEMLPVQDESWKEEEETVFVARASQFGDISPAPRAYGEQEQAGEAYTVQQQEPVAAETREAVPAKEPALTARLQPAEEPAPVLARADEAEEAAGETEVYIQPDEVDESKAVFAAEAGELAPVEEAEPIPQSAAAEPEEKKELKIAFGSKSENDASYHLKSLIHTGDTRSAPAAAVEEELAPTPRTDALEWKRLFVREEEQKFSRVRVYIVQKEDTLEAIAGRYSMNARELLLYNRLTEQDVSEGKTLFIPRS